MSKSRKPRTVFDPPERSSEPSTIDVLEAMFRSPMTKGLITDPRVRVIRSMDSATGRVTYSLRSPDDPSYSEDATPSD